jgi:hypothetical protein
LQDEPKSEASDEEKQEENMERGKKGRKQKKEELNGEMTFLTRTAEKKLKSGMLVVEKQKSRKEQEGIRTICAAKQCVSVALTLHVHARGPQHTLSQHPRATIRW